MNNPKTRKQRHVENVKNKEYHDIWIQFRAGRPIRVSMGPNCRKSQRISWNPAFYPILSGKGQETKLGINALCYYTAAWRGRRHRRSWQARLCAKFFESMVRYRKGRYGELNAIMSCINCLTTSESAGRNGSWTKRLFTLLIYIIY